MRTKTWAEKLGLTDAEYKDLCIAIRRTWEGIASDVMACGEQSRMRRSEVIEVTLDANRVSTQNKKELSEKVHKLLNSYEPKWYDTLKAALKEDVFKYQWYE